MLLCMHNNFEKIYDICVQIKNLNQNIICYENSGINQ